LATLILEFNQLSLRAFQKAAKARVLAIITTIKTRRNLAAAAMVASMNGFKYSIFKGSDMRMLLIGKE
jgi:hypothetical protein